MAYGGRFVDWLRSLTAKTTTIDGTEQVHIDSSGLSLKATLANVIRYGGGSPRNETIGNATITTTTDGALYLEVANGTNVIGNARGVGAFDWQSTRTLATAVASGARSVAMGAYATASGTESFAIFGTASGYGSVAINGSASAAYSVAIGLYSNASGYGSLAFNGGYTTNKSQVALCSPYGSNLLGAAQANLQGFYTITTDATLTPLNLTNTAVDRMVIPATRSVAFIGIVQAMCNVSSSSNFIKAWKIEGVITRDGSNTTRLVGTPTITEIAKDADGTPTPSTWAITSITADDTNEALAINVTGQAGTTIRWQATLLYSQIGF